MSLSHSDLAPTAYITLLGNPGRGKSTLLNGLAKKSVFSSGISIGTGLTTTLQRYDAIGFTLFDTPGLADSDCAEGAGLEIDRLLSEPIPLKIAFVVTLESGRVRHEDAAVIDVVLSSIQADTDHKFGIIVNKVTPDVLQDLEGDQDAERSMRDMLTGTHRTSFWYYVPTHESFSDSPNMALTIDGLEQFIHSLPDTKGTHDVVYKIGSARFDAVSQFQDQHIRHPQQITAEN